MPEQRLTTVVDNFSAGMNESRGRAGARPGQVQVMENMRPHKDGGTMLRYGSERANRSSTPPRSGPCVMLASFGQSSALGGPVYLVGIWIVTGTAYVDVSTNNGTSWTNIGSIAAAGTFYRYVWTTATMGGTTYLLFTNGYHNNLYYTDGTTLSSTATPITAASWVAGHAGRVWIARSDSPTVYASKINDFTNWTTPDGLSIPVGTQTGETIRGLFSTGGRLLVFQKRSVSFITGYGNSDIIVAAGAQGLIGSGTNAVMPRTIASTPIGTMWLAREGIMRFTEDGGLEEFVVEFDGLLEALDWSTMLGITTGGMDHGRIPVGAYDAFANEYVVAVDKTASSGYNDCLLRVNLQTKACYYDTLASHDIIAATGHQRTDRPAFYSAGSDGHVRYHDATNCVKDDCASETSGGQSYTGKIVLFPSDYGAARNEKRLREIGVTALVQGGSGTTITAYGTDGYLDRSNTGVAGTTHALSFTVAKQKRKRACVSVRSIRPTVTLTSTAEYPPTNNPAYVPVITAIDATAELLRNSTT